MVVLLLPLKVKAVYETLRQITKTLKIVQVQLEELKIKAKQEDFLTWLIQCESGGNSKAINTDDKKLTGFPSYGILQYQPKTLLIFGKKYDILPQEFTMKETMLVIWNPNLQKEIASKMIENKEYDHWANCLKIYPQRKSLPVDTNK